MARISRFVVPGLPHHVTQRGNRRERVFFTDDDYALYHGLLASQCRRHGVACWAYCLMPNHVHLILVPDRDEIARAGARRDPSALFDGDQCAARRDRASVPGAVRLGGDG